MTENKLDPIRMVVQQKQKESAEVLEKIYRQSEARKGKDKDAEN